MTWYMPWEIDFLNALQNIRNPILDKIMVFFSTLGNAGIFWIVIALILLIPKKTRWIGFECICAMLLTFIIGNLILKNVFDRTRPWVVTGFDQFPAGLKLPGDASFPSGHTMNSITASLVLLFNDKRMGIPAVIIAVLISFSRMYNYCHFPTDVIAGVVIGIVSAICMHLIFRFWRNKIQNNENKIPS